MEFSFGLESGDCFDDRERLPIELKNHWTSKMKFRVQKTPFWVIASGAAMVAAPAEAFQPSDVLSFSTGPVTLRPQVALAERFDDNILYRPNGPDKISDFVTTLSPNLTLMLGHKASSNPWVDNAEGSPNYLTVGYTLDENYYAKNDSLNYADHTFETGSQYVTDRIYIMGRDRLQLLNGLVGAYENLGYAVGRIGYFDNYKFGYNLTEKTSAYVVGNYSAVDYEKGTPLLDVNGWRGTLGFMWRALPKTSFFGEGYYGQMAENPNNAALSKGPHLESIGGFLGMTRTIGTKLNGTIKAGMEERSFAGSSESTITPVVDGNLNYQFSDKTSADLSYKRASNMSIQQVNLTYTSDNVGLNVYQRLCPSGKLRANAGVNCTMAGYDGSVNANNRSDLWVSFTAGLTYYVRAWMTTTLAYQYERFGIDYAQRYANVIDYSANRVTLRLAIGY
jgi:hypothetical protein